MLLDTLSASLLDHPLSGKEDKAISREEEKSELVKEQLELDKIFNSTLSFK